MRRKVCKKEGEEKGATGVTREKEGVKVAKGG
jgi:hypothetical protein